MDKLLRMPEVAEQLGVPVRTLEDWRLRGRGPLSARIGRRVMYRQRDVEAWIDEQFTAAEKTPA